jgi:hypothetical protein
MGHNLTTLTDVANVTTIIILIIVMDNRCSLSYYTNQL